MNPAHSALERLDRWLDAGGGWLLEGVEPDGSTVVRLLSCDGEPMDRLASTDPDFVAAVRPDAIG